MAETGNRELGGMEVALLPLLYVAWADGTLHLAELRSLSARLGGLWSLDASARQRLGRLLDPDQPPSEAELAEVLAEIRERSVGLEPGDRRSLSALGLAMAGVDQDACAEEMEALAEVESALRGSGSPAARRLLERDSWTVAEVMRRDPEVVSPEMPLSVLEQGFLSKSFGGFPVVERGRMVGIVSRSDIVRRLCLESGIAEEASDERHRSEVESAGDTLGEIGELMGRRMVELRVEDVMTRDVHTTTSDTTLSAAAAEMVRRGVHRLPVLSPAGDLVGMLTALDFVRFFGEGRVGLSAGDPDAG